MTRHDKHCVRVASAVELHGIVDKEILLLRGLCRLPKGVRHRPMSSARGHAAGSEIQQCE